MMLGKNGDDADVYKSFKKCKKFREDNIEVKKIS